MSQDRKLVASFDSRLDSTGGQTAMSSQLNYYASSSSFPSRFLAFLPINFSHLCFLFFLTVDLFFFSPKDKRKASGIRILILLKSFWNVNNDSVMPLRKNLRVKYVHLFLKKKSTDVIEIETRVDDDSLPAPRNPDGANSNAQK